MSSDFPLYYNSKLRRGFKVFIGQLTLLPSDETLTDSTTHSVPANKNPTTAMFLAIDVVRNFISFQTLFIVGVSVPVILGSIPDVKSPKRAPKHPP